MGLVIKSFILSFGVFGRMILPVLAIMVASFFVWSLLGVVSGGFSNYLSGPITATFISLVGIRAAFSRMGDRRSTDYKILALYAVLYGVFFLIAKGGALILSDIAAVLYADWKLGGAVSLRNFVDAEKSLQFAFALHALSIDAILSLVLYTSVFVVMAVPLASAARAAGSGASDTGFFTGVGRNFIPLFFVFSVSFFLQFFFGLFTSLFAAIPLFLTIVSIVLFQSLPDFDPDILMKGAVACAGLLWLHSWTWAASALALVTKDDDSKQLRAATPSTLPTPTDIRSLRKSRG